MKSVDDTRCGLSPPCWAVSCWSGAAQQAPADPNDPRIGLKPGCATPASAAREHGAGLDACRGPKASSIRRSRRATPMPAERATATPPTAADRAAPLPPPAAPALPAQRPARPPPPRRQAGRRRAGAAAVSTSPTPTSRSAGTHMCPGQLPWLQHLRHRERQEAAAACLGRLPRRAGRRLGARQPAVHVGGADPRPHRLRHAGRRRHREQGTLPRRPHLRHQRHAQAPARWRRCRPAAARTPTRSCRTRTTSRGSTSTARAPARCARAKSSTDCSGGDPKKNPQHRALQHRRDRSAARRAARRRAIVNRPRIFADETGNIAGLWTGGDHGPGTQRTSTHQPVPRHHGVPRSRAGRGRVLGQRHPDGHLGSGEPEAARSR